jgi:hypothetical protein
MPGPGAAIDEALQQALNAQMPRRAYGETWQRFKSAPAAASTPPPLGQPRGARSIPRTAARAGSNGASQGPVRTPDGASGPAAAGGTAETAEAARRLKPVPPARTREQSQAALDAARRRNAALKAIRARLQAGQLALAELLALAQSDPAAAKMLVRTALMALPGIRTARAAQLMSQAGIGDGRRVGSLTDEQRARLTAACAALAAGRARRT